MAIKRIDINRAVSPDTKKLPPAQDIWASLQRRLKGSDPSPQNRVSFVPAAVTVRAVHDSIFWTNNDSVAHWPGLLNDDGTINPTFFIDNQIAPNGDVSADFGSGRPVSFRYECSLHRGQGEEGTITFILTKGSGKGAPPLGVTGPEPRGRSVDGETVTVVLDRRTAENAYYALALALGGVDRPGAGGEWTGRMTGKTHKGNGKTVGKAYP